MKIFLRLLPLALLLMTGCQQEGFKTHQSGLKYKFIEKHDDAPKPEKGDVLELTVIIENQKDSVIYDTREIPGAFRMKLGKPRHSGGSIQDAYSLMHQGDSLLCQINAGNFFRKTRKSTLPDNVSASEHLLFRIKLHKIYGPEQYSKLRKQRKERRRQEEQSYLQQYLLRNNIEQSPRPSGLYFISKRKGKGQRPEPGDSVKVHYKGLLLNGQKFDSSYDRDKPFTFKLGANKVIPGWEEGVALMKQSGKARLIIPSHLAYGEKGLGETIPPYSTLIFDIELLKVY